MQDARWGQPSVLWEEEWGQHLNKSRTWGDESQRRDRLGIHGRPDSIPRGLGSCSFLFASVSCARIPVSTMAQKIPVPYFYLFFWSQSWIKFLAFMQSKESCVIALFLLKKLNETDILPLLTIYSATEWWQRTASRAWLLCGPKDSLLLLRKRKAAGHGGTCL